MTIWSNRRHPTFDSVNQNALDRIDVLQYPGHDVAGGAIIEPSQRKLLNVRVEVTAEIEDYLLLKRVVEDDAQPIEQVAKRIRSKGNQDQTPEPFATPAPDFVDENRRHLGENHDHRGGDDGAEQRRRCIERIPAHIAQDAEDNLHDRPAGLARKYATAPRTDSSAGTSHNAHRCRSVSESGGAPG